MAMNLARTGVAAVVGAGSAAIRENTTPLDLGGTPVSWGVVAEAAAVLIGGGMQLLAPFTMPDIADGLVDGGIALLAADGTRWALTRPAAGAYAMPNRGLSQPTRVGALDGGATMGAYARPQIGNVPAGSRRVKLG